MISQLVFVKLFSQSLLFGLKRGKILKLNLFKEVQLEKLKLAFTLFSLVSTRVMLGVKKFLTFLSVPVA